MTQSPLFVSTNPFVNNDEQSEQGEAPSKIKQACTISGTGAHLDTIAKVQVPLDYIRNNVERRSGSSVYLQTSLGLNWTESLKTLGHHDSLIRMLALDPDRFKFWPTVAKASIIESAEHSL